MSENISELVPFFSGTGYGVEDAEDVDTALGEILSQQVTMEPLRVEHGGKSIIVPNRYATVREDGAVLGTGLSDRYEVVQNTDAFGWMNNLFQSGEARPKRAGTFKDGSVAYVLAELNRKLKVGDIAGEDITTYFLGCNFFDGKGSMLGRFLPMRLICKNGLMAPVDGISREIRIRHVAGASEKAIEADRILLHAQQYMDGFEDLANTLVGQTMTTSAFGKFLERLIPLRMDENPDKDRSAKNKLEAREAIAAIFANGENLANVRETKWAAYNAVAEYFDHHTISRSTAADEADADDSRAENRMLRITSDFKLKDQALALLTK